MDLQRMEKNTMHHESRVSIYIFSIYFPLFSNGHASRLPVNDILAAQICNVRCFKNPCTPWTTDMSATNPNIPNNIWLICTNLAKANHPENIPISVGYMVILVAHQSGLWWEVRLLCLCNGHTTTSGSALAAHCCELPASAKAHWMQWDTLW